jgi:hypothetical protein
MHSIGEQIVLNRQSTQKMNYISEIEIQVEVIQTAPVVRGTQERK